MSKVLFVIVLSLPEIIATVLCAIYEYVQILDSKDEKRKKEEHIV